ncbi:MAG TPA: hypothetical protein VFN30_12785 [Chitinophagaceae bacterium]|nr:hypothetical protein [Chitinophagaceae bacterium]
MAIPHYLLAAFEEGGIYHIICKSINEKSLFREDRNKHFFLKKYQQFLADYIETFAYCLLDNHAHFLIRIKTLKEITDRISLIPPKEFTILQGRFMENAELLLNDLVIRQFNSFFVSYTRSFNNLYKRKGHLFETPFKRIVITDSAHFSQLVIYIHANPLKHRFVNDFTGYEWSSYKELINNFSHLLNRDYVIEWFGGEERFIKIHKEQIQFYYDLPLTYATE